MSMTLKTTKILCFGLSVVFKITTRRSTIDVRKKSDLSRKNRTTGPPGHVRKISDQPQPVDLGGGHSACSASDAVMSNWVYFKICRLFNIKNRLKNYLSCWLFSQQILKYIENQQINTKWIVIVRCLGCTRCSWSQVSACSDYLRPPSDISPLDYLPTSHVPHPNPPTHPTHPHPF